MKIPKEYLRDRYLCKKMKNNIIRFIWLYPKGCPYIWCQVGVKLTTIKKIISDYKHGHLNTWKLTKDKNLLISNSIIKFYSLCNLK